MPQLGERVKSQALGKESGHTYEYASCPTCGFARWVELPCLLRTGGRCQRCAHDARRGKTVLKLRGANNSSWKGGKILRGDGYFRVSIYPEDMFYSMATVGKEKNTGYVLEHRLVMAKHLGRCLEPWEVVHHINGERSDNRLENLELLTSQTEHLYSIRLQQEVNKLRKRVEHLEKQILFLEGKQYVPSI